jgi:hypothetical protein
MITERTMEAIAKLYFEENLTVLRIAQISEHLTVGNVVYCIKEMQHNYHPVIINPIVFPGKSDRNAKIAKLFESGLTMTEIARRYTISIDRVKQIIVKAIRYRFIHVNRVVIGGKITLVRDNIKVIDEPYLSYNRYESTALNQFVNAKLSKTDISEKYNIPYEIVDKWIERYLVNQLLSI